MRLQTLLWMVLSLAAATGVAQGSWQPILTEDFSGSPSSWTYSGRLNGSSQSLIRLDSGGGGQVAAEWDQSTGFNGTGDPYTIESSRLSRSLGTSLTDSDTFKVGVTLRIGSVVDTTEFYQIANFGLYGLSQMGQDRTMSDNYSGNTTLIKDGSDFVEFNYFTQNNSFGFNPMTQASIGAHVTGLAGNYTVGSGVAGDPLWHDTDMGTDNWLPTGQDLFVEVTYDSQSRRAHSAIYTDSARTTLLSVNGVQQYYWTQALPGGDHFTLTDVAFYNYVGANWGGANGQGAGTFDDLYVIKQVPEPVGLLFLAAGWAAVARAARRRRADR